MFLYLDKYNLSLCDYRCFKHLSAGRIIQPGKLCSHNDNDFDVSMMLGSGRASPVNLAFIIISGETLRLCRLR